MKLSALSLSLLTLAASLVTAAADTIKLKDGKTIECVITTENADSYEVEIELGKGIKDFKTIKKADVAEVKRVKPDEREAMELKTKLGVTADNMSAADYEKRIKTDIQPWLDKYKTSTKRAEVEALLKLYTDEMAKVKAGEVKLRGTWITAEEVKWNAYNIAARKLRVKMEEQIKAKKFVEAYATFSELEATGVAGVDYPQVVEAIKKGLPGIESTMSAAAADFPAQEAKRKEALAAMTPEARKAEDERRRKELAEFTAKVAIERKNKVMIPSYLPTDLRTIQTAQAAVKKENERLSKLDLPGITAANKKFEQGLKDLAAKSYAAAKSNFEPAAKLHSRDAAVKKYLEEATKGASATAKPGGK